MAGAAYTVVGLERDVGMAVQALNELGIITCRVITNKAVEFWRDLEGIKYRGNNDCLRSTRMVAVEVPKGNKYVALLVFSIYQVLESFKNR